MSDYAFHRTSFGMPSEVEGSTEGGRRFYFRARHGRWALHLAPAVGAELTLDDSEIIAEGDDPSHGWMDDAEVRAILDARLPRRA